MELRLEPAGIHVDCVVGNLESLEALKKEIPFGLRSREQEGKQFYFRPHVPKQGQKNPLDTPEVHNSRKQSNTQIEFIILSIPLQSMFRQHLHQAIRQLPCLNDDGPRKGQQRELGPIKQPIQQWHER
jgi:hypothetical protein